MGATIRRGNSAGFTLVEVMLVVFVLALTALIFATAFPTSQISRMKAAHMSFATSLAQQTLEEKRSAGYSGLLVGTNEVSIPPDLPNGQMTTTITQYAPNIKKVVVTVTWSGYRKVGGRVSLATLVSDHS